jgi:hypothetical protein
MPIVRWDPIEANALIEIFPQLRYPDAPHRLCYAYDLLRCIDGETLGETDRTEC